MKNYWNVLFFLGLQLLAGSGYAQVIDVSSLRYSTTSKQNRMMFDVTASPQHRVFVMDNPSRLVIDIKNAQLKRALNQPSTTHPLFARVRVGTKNETDLRIVVDLKTPISSKKFSLKSNISDDHRLIVDLFNKGTIFATKPENNDADKLVTSNSPEFKTVATKSSAGKSTESKKSNSIVIAIDAGHGGNDSGAHGPHGTEEKKVTFAIAKKTGGIN
jgi:N-acetylmuramoyl-L-alanine amidase